MIDKGEGYAKKESERLTRLLSKVRLLNPLCSAMSLLYAGQVLFVTLVNHFRDIFVS